MYDVVPLYCTQTFSFFSRRMQANFSEERNWDQFHTPRNILLALVSYSLSEGFVIFLETFISHLGHNFMSLTSWNSFIINPGSSHGPLLENSQ